VRDQSHKNEMRAALRGDFERLRARQASSDTTPERVARLRNDLREPEQSSEQQAASPAPTPEPSQLPEPGAYLEGPVPEALEPEPDSEPEAEPEAEREVEREVEPPVRRSRLRSLFRRA
jgi:hypothetical protein